MKPYFLVIIFILDSFLSFSQEGTPIKRNKQFYLYGNTAVIGNNIVSEHATNPFNDDFKVNDEIRMKYVDIDDDLTTFSSSQATLNLPADHTNIVYAALYWSAVYKYDYGHLKKDGKTKVYSGDNISRNPLVNMIKLKMPNDSYEFIVGDIIYDDFKKNLFEKNTPYACYADITDLLKEAETVNGDYTVANINATQGNISGGCSGGWMLYVVYEAPTESPIYVTTYNGFIQVNRDNHSNIVFKDFKTKETGFVKTYLTLAALEGDNQLKTDQCLIYNPIDSSYVALGNSIRKIKNIFNSKITINEFEFKDRRPFSTNTLGFDILQMELPNPNNELVSNDVDQITMQIKTKTDRFYLFFSAFQTEISQLNYNQNKDKQQVTPVATIIKEPVVEKNEEIIDSIELSSIPKTEIISVVETETIPVVETETIPVVETETIPVVETTLNNDDLTNYSASEKEEIEKVMETHVHTIPSLLSGYYIVTNVFSRPANTKKWVELLKGYGHSPEVYSNPKNNWEYVYIFSSPNKNEAYVRFKELAALTYLEKIWVSKVNLPKAK